jgi:hypothetical protein
MAKIVDFMKKRHLNGQQWPLSLRELLDEMQVFWDQMLEHNYKIIHS